MTKRFALITHHDNGYKPLADLTWEGNKVLYAEKHGYGYHAKKENWYSPLPNGSMSGFEKIFYAREILQTHPEYEWIWWTGSDTLITNFLIGIEDKIDNNYHFIVSTDILGLNVDSFLVRNSLEGKAFLDAVLSKQTETMQFWDTEQRAICYVLGFPGTGEPGWPTDGNVEIKNEYKNVAKIMPQRFMNSFNYNIYAHYKDVPHRDRMNTDGNWTFGDWLIHWPATSLQERIKLANFYQNYVVK